MKVVEGMYWSLKRLKSVVLGLQYTSYRLINTRDDNNMLNSAARALPQSSEWTRGESPNPTVDDLRTDVSHQAEKVISWQPPFFNNY
jgi:hypothetical protein